MVKLYEAGSQQSDFHCETEKCRGNFLHMPLVADFQNGALAQLAIEMSKKLQYLKLVRDFLGENEFCILVRSLLFFHGRITFNHSIKAEISTMAFKTINGLAPEYLSELFHKTFGK